jgi:site-specific recombinase XerD
MKKTAPTKADGSFHYLKSDYAERSINKALANGRITKRDVDLIREFLMEQQSCSNISVGRKNKITFLLVGLRKFIGEYESNSIADLYEGINKLKNGVSERGRPYKTSSIIDFLVVLKQFYRWLIENGYSTIPEKKLNKIKNPREDCMTKEAGDLLTPEEIKSIIRVCQRSIDRALVMTLYEGGFRIGELGSLAWKDVLFDEHGVIVNTNFKTGKPRYVRLVMAKEYLAVWKSDYPFEPEGENLVFVSARRNGMTYQAISKQLKKLVARAGIEKHVTPHLFRHSRITHLIKEGVNESVIKLMMWGSVNSRQFKTYAHLTGTDIDNEILSRYGITPTKEKGENALVPKQCKKCQAINAPDTNYCPVCGASLTDEAEVQMEEAKRIISNDKEVLRSILTELLEERGEAGIPAELVS